MNWIVKGSIGEAASPYLHRHFDGHQTAVYGAAWLSNGTILTWSGDWTLRRWDLHTGELVQILSDSKRTRSGFGGIRGAVEISDQRIVSWGFDGVINVWSQQSTEPVHRLVGHTQPVNGVLEIEPGKLLSWSGDMTFRIWNLEDGGYHSVLPLLASSDDMLASKPPLIVQSDGGIVFWSGNELLYLEKDSDRSYQAILDQEEDILCAIQLPNGRLVTFGEQGTLLEWQLPELRCTTKYQSVRAHPMDLCQLGDGRFVTRAAGRIWIWRSGVDVADVVIDPPADAIAGVAPLPDYGLVYRTLSRNLVVWNEGMQWRAELPDWHEPIRLVPCSESLIAVWSARESWMKVVGLNEEYALTPYAGQLTAVELRQPWNSPHRTVLTTTRDGAVDCWDLSMPHRSHPAGHTAHHLSAIRSLNTFDPTRIVACHQGGEISIHNAETGEALHTLPVEHFGSWGPADGMLKLSAHRILVWHLPACLTVWDVDRGEVLGQLTSNNGPVGPTIRINERLALSWSSLQYTSGFLLWDYINISPIKVLEVNKVSLGAAAIRNDEFITWSEDPYLRRWRATGDLVEKIKLHNESMRGVLQLDNDTFLTWVASGHLAVWSSGQEIVKYHLQQTKANLMSATLGFGSVLFCTEDQRLLLWDFASQTEYLIPYNPAGLIFHIAPLSDTQWLIVDRSGLVAITTINGCESSYSVSPYALRPPVVSSDGEWLFVGEDRELIALSIQGQLTSTAYLRLATRVEVLLPLTKNLLAVGGSDGRVAICDMNSL